MSAEAIVAIFAVVVSAVSVYFAFGQARSARQSAASAKDQASAARDSVAAAREQVTAAHRQVELQEQMWRDQAQPYVVADVRPDLAHGQFFQVVLENRGTTIARNVHVIFDPPLQMNLSTKKGPFTALDSGISYLPPGRLMTWYLGVSAGFFGGDEPVPDREVTVTCDGPLGPVDALRYTLSFETLRHQPATAPGTLRQVEQAVKDVAKAISAQKR